MTSNIEKKVFKPRPSTGWVWVGVLGLALLGTGLSQLLQSGLSGPFLVTILLTNLIGIVFLVIAAFFPTMQYEMEGANLIMTYGLLLRYVLNIKQVKSIKRRDLGISILASFRFPGLALFSVP